MYKMGMNDAQWRIFEQAVYLFAEKTYFNVSVREIAEAVGLLPGSLYNHFPSKDDILQKIYGYYTYCSTSIVPDLDDVLARAETEHPHKLLRWIMLQRFPEDNQLFLSKIFIIVVSQLACDPRADDVLEACMRKPSADTLQATLERMIALDRIEPLDIDAFIIFHRSLSHYISYAVARGNAEMPQQWSRYLDMLISLVKVRETVTEDT